jgi:hypothetical protein
MKVPSCSLSATDRGSPPHVAVSSNACSPGMRTFDLRNARELSSAATRARFHATHRFLEQSVQLLHERLRPDGGLSGSNALRIFPPRMPP